MMSETHLLLLLHPGGWDQSEMLMTTKWRRSWSLSSSHCSSVSLHSTWKFRALAVVPEEREPQYVNHTHVTRTMRFKTFTWDEEDQVERLQESGSSGAPVDRELGRQAAVLV